ANPSYKTKIAVEYTVDDSVRCTGIAVRNETVIGISQSGIVSFLVHDGEKVAAGSAVAELYSNRQTALDKLIRDTLNGEYEAYGSASASPSSGNIVSLQKQLEDRLVTLAGAISSGSLEGFYDARNALIREYSVFLSVSGGGISYDGVRDEVRAKISEHEMGQPNSYVYAGESGYFYSATDGYEDQISIGALQEMTPEAIRAVIDAPAPNVRVNSCKLISGYDWKFCAVVDADSASRFSPGRTMPITFRYTSAATVNCTVDSVNYSEDGTYAVVTFSCDLLNSDIAGLRVQEADISFRNYRGIRIDRSSLRFEDGVVGVYIKYGSTVMFRKLDIVYENDEYVISRIDASDSDLLKLYDEIITEGKDLYVGKEL
ncbi:MAG: hypothetical protein IKD62_02440, partial [Oscillospiraceae bacterium]|nr:hypothetical protein [Oscillospiraceae bacterium]